jgi:transposase
MGAGAGDAVFVACLPCSNLGYAEITWTQGQEGWLGSHVRALAAIGGCPGKLVPDNLKSGVTNAWYYDPALRACCTIRFPNAICASRAAACH